MKHFFNIFIMSLIVVVSIPTTAFSANQNQENIFYYHTTDSAYKSVENNYSNIDILAPQIYTVGYNLTLGSAEDENILKLAKKNRIKTMPLVVNANFNKTLMSQILADTDIQDEIIDDLIKEARKRKFIGWQFDFENISHLDRDAYVDFVDRAYKAFKKKRLKLSVAVIPRTTDYDPFAWSQDWSSGYNIPEIAKKSDFVSIMSYDDPLSYGPVASISYVKKSLAHTLKNTPASKISLGVPFYCWQWETTNTGTKKIANLRYETAAATKEKYKNNHFFSKYSTAEEAEFFSFIKDDGSHHIIWCDNTQSLKTKQSLVKEHRLRGISAWALGQEDPEIWKVL